VQSNAKETNGLPGSLQIQFKDKGIVRQTDAG
jgi:hypothetical protein